MCCLFIFIVNHVVIWSDGINHEFMMEFIKQMLSDHEIDLEKGFLRPFHKHLAGISYYNKLYGAS